MFILGITGPTGSGKSEAADYFRGQGILVLDADQFAGGIIAKSAKIKQDLAAEFGQDILDANGALRKKLLAERAFSSTEKAARLSQITHPAILQAMRRELTRLASSGIKRCVIDAPLLFESGADQFCGKTLGVLADEEIRLARVMARDGINEQAALRRMRIQPGDEFYRLRADMIMENNGGKQALFAKLAQLGEQLFENNQMA